MPRLNHWNRHPIKPLSLSLLAETSQGPLLSDSNNKISFLSDDDRPALYSQRVSQESIVRWRLHGPIVLDRLEGCVRFDGPPYPKKFDLADALHNPVESYSTSNGCDYMWLLVNVLMV